MMCSSKLINLMMIRLQNYFRHALKTLWPTKAADPFVGTKLSKNGPVALPKNHALLFGNVDGEHRGPDAARLIDPPIKRVDELFWLRDDSRSDETVLAHINEENKFTQQKTRHLIELQERIYREHVTRLQEDEDSVPFQYYAKSKFLYFVRQRKGCPYEIYCRVPLDQFDFDELSRQAIQQTQEENSLSPHISAGEVILDVNALASSRKAEFCSIGLFLPHPSNDEIYAYSVDLVGAENYDIHFTGADWAPILATTGDFVWSSSGAYLFYVTKDDAHRPCQVWAHRNGAESECDTCIFEESDELYEVVIDISRCRSYLAIHSASTETNEIHLLSLGAIEERAFEKHAIVKDLMCIRKREYGHKYTAEVHPSGHLYILTNQNGANNQLIRCSLSADSSQKSLFDDSTFCETLVSHDPERYLEDVELFQEYIVLLGRESGLSQIWTISLENSSFALTRVDMPDALYSVVLSPTNHIFDTKWIRITYSTPQTPQIEMNLHLATHDRITLDQEKVKGYNPDDYEVRKCVARSFDDTPVNISMIMKKGTKRDSSNGLFLYGYGSYGACTEPRFRRTWIPYLERGMICCIAHIRGGSENGYLWYEQGGKYLTKRNTFMDFISCAEYLIQERWTDPSKLAIEGRSAGGLLIGAVVNMRPDLFQVAVASVPFVDVMASMCDASIPLTAGEWEEWGNPNEYRFYDYMLSYSPMDNVRPQKYPHLLILAGLHDQRVQFWEPIKWASKIRSLTTGDKDVIVKVDMNAGHFSASDRYRMLNEIAFEQSYIISKVLAE
ncbi:oligopeptidase [Perkinsela sp. CCAP 1560/4]|nr:oligopeptidase [Perkinsela sp. CCAP 1560/4]|eukprot:KNH04898.1 oligopeptidase [Perkinsela sp. CCAP 1560/4]